MPLEKEEKSKIVSSFGRHDSDSGSAEVQIAMLTERIRQLQSTSRLTRRTITVGSVS